MKRTGTSHIASAWHNIWSRWRSKLDEVLPWGSGRRSLWAALIALVLAVLSLIRWQRYPQAVREDLTHPVRHVFVAAMPISLILLATVATALTGPSRPALEYLEGYPCQGYLVYQVCW